MSIVNGYKATNAEMQCQGYQFTLGEWHEHDGELELCKSGFHFCKHPSGVWAYYDDPGTRVFEVEAEGVLDLPVTPGADYKMVARKIRLVREVVFTGDKNTENRNTGNWNTGNRNTGYGNATNYSAGFFCTEQPTVRVFDVDSGLTREQFIESHPGWWGLCYALMLDDHIPFEQFSDIPGITPEKLQRLHELHKAGRDKAASKKEEPE